MRREEEGLFPIQDLKEGKRDRYNNVDAKVSGVVILISSIFVIFLMFVAMDLIGNSVF